MTTERLEVQRTIGADPASIFEVLCDPAFCQGWLPGRLIHDKADVQQLQRPAAKDRQLRIATLV